MVANQKPTGRALSMPAGLALGGILSLVITLIAAAILAKLIESEILPESAMGYGILALLIVSAAAGAMLAHQKIKRQRLLVCGLAGAVYYGILLAITALFFGGQYRGMGVTALAVLAGTALAVLPGMQGRGGGKQKRYKIRSR